MRSVIAVVAGLIVGFFTSVVCAQTAKLTVDVGKPGIAVSPTLYGIFFEEINRAGDGGLYAEMLQNRSFEDFPGKPLAWELVVPPNSKAKWTLDRGAPLNADNPTFLRVNVEQLGDGERVSIVNRGFAGAQRRGGETDDEYADRFVKAVADQKGHGHGIAVRGGAEYVVSFYARAMGGFGRGQGGGGGGNPERSLTLELQDGSGKTVASQEVSGIGNEWKKFEATLKPQSDGTDLAFAISTARRGTYHFDMISMFPRDTFKGRTNGLRKDIAQMIVAMKPAFVRFPGGCFVEGDEINHATRWKQTIGDISERPGHWNLWGYRSTDGLGMFEYLQFCEDLGAEPLFVINVGMSHHLGRNNAYAVPMEQMDEYVQDALDAIEYCNGPADSKWGSVRAKAGHPEPFNLKYMEIGNENGGPRYHERYALFYDAIKAKYPQMNVIVNVWEGLPTNRPYDVKDEHYYNTPGFFLRRSDMYDGYDRKGAKVYVGEYAVTRGNVGLGNLAAAVGEAAFMMGMERNSDIVTMASYAPLLCEPAWKAWNPNAINFDGGRVFGTPSYHLQCLFANNRPDVIVPATIDTAELPSPPPPQGRFGLGTWDTQAEFKDIKVTDPDGKTLWEFDPAKGIEQLDIPNRGGGEWEIVDGAVRQTAGGPRPALAFAGDRSWGDYTITLKARKISGNEGFLVAFRMTDPGERRWWNIGGWGNRQHGLEGPELAPSQVNGSIETGRWYDIKIDLRGRSLTCYLDGEKVHEATFATSTKPQVAAGIDRKAGEVVIKVVNPSTVALATDVTLNGVLQTDSTGRAMVLTSEKDTDENSFEQPDKIAPREQTVNVGKNFRHTFPAHSVTVLRVKASTN